MQSKQDTTNIQNNHDCGSDTATTTSSSTPSRNPKKRAKKSNNHNGNGSEQQAPRSWSLDILVGSVEIVDDLLCRHSDSTSNNSDLNTKRFTLESILLTFHQHNSHANLSQEDQPKRKKSYKIGTQHCGLLYSLRKRLRNLRKRSCYCLRMKLA